MSDLNKKGVKSKTFTLELDTGQTKKVPIKNSRGRTIGQRDEPITISVPKMSTISSYDVAEDGTVSNVNSKVRQVVTKEQFDKLKSNNKLSDFATTEQVGRGRSRTVYYATLATRDGKTGKYSPTAAIVEVLPENTAKLFKQDIAKENVGDVSSFSTVSNATQQKISQLEGLKPGDPKDKTGLSPSNAGANADTAPQQNALPQFEVIGLPIRRKYPDLRYPKERHETQDYIQFKMLEYKGLNFERGTLGGLTEPLSESREFGTIEGSVTLPMQSKISDINTVNWGESDINPLQAVGLGLLNSNDALKNLETLKENVTNNTAGVLSNTVSAAKILAFQEALQVKGLLARTTGAIFNPNTELLFRGPQLRPFGFSFFLAARNQPEANEIKQIIRFFKQGMSIKESTDNLFLKTPNVFNIRYVFGRNGQDHPGLNKIKTCALKSCSVDYNPDNTFMTFEDGTMTAYRITMQFQELLPITESDYLDADEEAARINQGVPIGPLQGSQDFSDQGGIGF